MTGPVAGERGYRAGTAVAGVAGGAGFLLGTILHPARDGHGVAEAGDTYGLTHGLQALGLMALVVALAGTLAVAGKGAPRPGAWIAALVGTVTWLGLIVYDGAHNPATAQHAPELVHTSDDLTLGGALLIVPALVLFPLGNAILAVALMRHRRRMVGPLLGAGALVYWAGGLLIFALGPDSPAIAPVEVAGAAAYAVGFVLLSIDLARPAAAPR